MRRHTGKPRKPPTRFFEDYDYYLLILEDSDVDELIKLYSTHIETNDISIKERSEYKLLLDTYSRISTLASHCTDKTKINYVKWAIDNLETNSDYSEQQVHYCFSFFMDLIKSKDIYDNNNLTDINFDISEHIYKYFDLFIVHNLLNDEDCDVLECHMVEFDFIIMRSGKFKTIYDILKFMNLDADLNISIIEYLKLINSMTNEQFYSLALQQLARRYNKEWFYSQMPNTFKTAEEARVAFEIMMNFKYDGNVSK